MASKNEKVPAAQPVKNPEKNDTSSSSRSSSSATAVSPTPRRAPPQMNDLADAVHEPDAPAGPVEPSPVVVVDEPKAEPEGPPVVHESMLSKVMKTINAPTLKVHPGVSPRRRRTL